LGKDTGIPITTINSWFRKGENRITPSYKYLKAVADYFGVTPEFLQYGSGADSTEGKPIIKQPLVKRMPKHGIESDPDVVEDYACLPEASRGSIIIKIKDNSMSPQIERGSYVVFTRDPDCSSSAGDIVVINNELGDSFVRRYRVRDNTPFFVADNPEYQALTPSDGYYIVGKVTDIWTRREP
jgi:SOS-response transcriptional repressor LexA